MSADLWKSLFAASENTMRTTVLTIHQITFAVKAGSAPLE